MRGAAFLATWALVALAALPAERASAEQPVPFEKHGRWGYRDVRGGIAIPPRFDLANPFSPEGIAAVVDEKGWAYIDIKGKLVIRPFVFDNGPDYFSEGLARFTSGGKFGFFDRHGKVVIPPGFDFAAPFSDGLAAVCVGCKEVFQGEHSFRKGGRWGFTDRSGSLVIPARFDEVRQFEKGKARVRLGERWQYIDKAGEVMEEEPGPSPPGLR